MPVFLSESKWDFDEQRWQGLLISEPWERFLPTSLVLPWNQFFTALWFSSKYIPGVHSSSITRGHRVPSKHHPCGCGSLHLFFAELWNGLQSLELNRVSCITNAHLFPSANFREHLCLLLAWLATMKPNKVGLGRTSWDHLIHYPFPKAYRVNNGTASLQTPAARLWKFGFS